MYYYPSPEGLLCITTPLLKVYFVLVPRPLSLKASRFITQIRAVPRPRAPIFYLNTSKFNFLQVFCVHPIQETVRQAYVYEELVNCGERLAYVSCREGGHKYLEKSGQSVKLIFDFCNKSIF